MMYDVSKIHNFGDLEVIDILLLVFVLGLYVSANDTVNIVSSALDEIRAEIQARNANPLTLVASTKQPTYHP
ncbi:hypothetical protein Tco_0330241 [Tanacetum coccineum]